MKLVFANVSVLATLALLGACVSAPTGPKVGIAPGPGKSADEFRNDHAACMSFAQQQMGNAQQQLASQQAGGALLGGALGAGIGAAVGSEQGGGKRDEHRRRQAQHNSGNTGKDALIGGLAGALTGLAAGTASASATQANMQRQYDLVYAQCMYGRGNVVPGFRPPPAYGAAY